MKKLSRRQMNSLMRFLIDFAYANVPGDEKTLFKHSPVLNEKLNSLGLEDRKDQALHVLAGYELIKFEQLPKSGRTIITLTNKGKAYFEQKRDARIAFLGKSILLPILVSIITTILAVYILPSAGRQVERWFQGSQSQTTQSQTEPAPLDDPAANPATLQESSIEAHP